MCFSVAGSLAASAILIPTGIYCINKALLKRRSHLPLAMIPLMFGIQQALEGGVWLSMAAGDVLAIRLFALGYLFFSHFFWLLWTPFASFSLERDPKLKWVFGVITVFGILFGASLYLPLLVHTDWLQVSLVYRSIHYKTTFWYNTYMDSELIWGVYVMVILVPLLLSSRKRIRLFGVLVMGSAIVEALFFDYSLISMWCYFAALLSFYILLLIHRLDRPKRIGG